MAAARAQQHTASANRAPSPNVVGQAFAHQYYTILHQSPGLLHRFYQDISQFGRVDDYGNMSITTRMADIDKKVLSFGTLKAELKSVDAQESYGGGLLLLITGTMTNQDESKKNFTQTFFLAPQDRGYYVLNDIFRFVDDNNEKKSEAAPDAPREAPHHGNADRSEDGEGVLVEQKEPVTIDVHETTKQSDNADYLFEDEELVTFDAPETPKQSEDNVDLSEDGEGVLVELEDLVTVDVPETTSKQSDNVDLFEDEGVLVEQEEVDVHETSKQLDNVDLSQDGEGVPVATDVHGIPEQSGAGFNPNGRPKKSYASVVRG